MPTARRRSPDLGQFFTFGGRVPASVGLLIAAILVASVLGWQSPGFRAAAAFFPGAILAGQLWRLVSWFFVQPEPFGLLFVGFMLWWLGPQLVYEWGERRFLLRLVGITAGASLLATALALAWTPAGQPHLGAWPTVNALIIAWAMIYPDRQVNIWGILPISGKMLALLVVFGTVLYSLAGRGGAGFGAFVLHFAAMAIAFAFSRGLSLGGFVRKARRNMDERELRRRAKHLKVVHRRDGQDEPPRWIN